jgi:hypothetical protein
MVQLEAVGPLTNKVLNISEGYVDWQREGSTGISALPFSESASVIRSKYPKQSHPSKRHQKKLPATSTHEACKLWNVADVIAVAGALQGHAQTAPQQSKA